MPYRTVKTNGGYANYSPHRTLGKHMTKKNAKKQINLLQAIEHNPEFAKMIKTHKGGSKKVAMPRK